MNKTKSTKRALLMSALALLLCVSMLIGSTYAWFTDTAVSKNNKIVAGNLEVDLIMWNGTKYESIADQDAAIFGAGSLAQNVAEETLWEPGKTQIVYLGVANKGSLDLKYNILLNVIDGGLIGSLEYAIVDGATNETTLPANWSALKDLAETGDIVAGTTVAAPNGAIKAGTDAVDYFALAVHMKEEAGNQYQNKDITIDVTVAATQLASEEDTFGPTYDKMATIDDEEELKKALEDGTELIVLGSNLELSETLVIPANKTVTIDLKGYTMSHENACTAHYAMIDNKGTLTVKDSVGGGKISFTDTGAGDPTFGWGAYTINTSGTLVVESGTIENLSAQNVDGEGPAHMVCAIQQAGGSVTVNGGLITTPHYRSIRTNRGSLEINGGVMDGQVWIHPFAEGISLTIKGGSFSPNWNDGSSVYIENGSKAVAFSMTNGSFATKLGSAKPADLAKTVSGGIFGTAPTAYLADGYVAAKNADGLYEVIEGVLVANTTELKSAVDAGKTEVYLADGNYYVPEIQGKTVKLIGGKGAVIDASDDSYGYQTLSGANITFEGVTIKGTDFNFTCKGFQHAKVTFNDCTIVNELLLNEDSVFTECTFETTGDIYGIWTWGARNATFTKCTFNTDGKAILLYGGANGTPVGEITTVLTLNECTFNDKGGLTAKKAAVEIGNGYTNANYKLIANQVTVNGYEINDTGLNTASTLWGNKNAMGTDTLDVIIDGVDVY